MSKHVFFILVQLVLVTTSAEQLPDALKKILHTRKCIHCDLRNLDLSGQQLQGVNLSGSDLTGSNLEMTNFRGANLNGAILLNVRLIDTQFMGADLKNTDFSDIDIDEVFESIEIIGTQLKGARFKYDVTCGPPPTRGGWGCQHQ